jgi:hypothetical protein
MMKSEKQSGSEESTSCVIETTGNGESERKIARVLGWPVTSFTGKGDHEQRIPAGYLAEKLGYAEPNNIRKLVASLSRQGKMCGHAVLGVQEFRAQGGGRPAREFYLTESQALKVIAKSETKLADAILDEMIEVYRLARRGLLPQQSAQLPAQALAFFETMTGMVRVVRENQETQAKQISKQAEVILRLETKLEERTYARGLLGREKAKLILTEVCLIADLCGHARKTPAWRSYRGKREIELRRHVGLAQSTRWEDLPASQDASAAVKLKEMRLRAEGEAAGREQMKQRTLFDALPAGVRAFADTNKN